MNASGKKRKKGPKYGDAPIEKHVTLADEHRKKLMEKQLEKTTTLTRELNRKRIFKEPILVKDDSLLKAGAKTLSEFQILSEHEKQTNEWREHGLTEQEISLKIQFEQGQITDRTDRTILAKFDIIEQKIKTHHNDLKKDVKYSDSITLSRRELETEQSFYRGSNSTKDLEQFVNLKNESKVFPKNDPVIATLKEYEKNEKERLVKKGQPQLHSTNHSMEDSEEVEESDDDSDNFIGPLLSNVNTRADVIPVETIFNNRLSLNDIHSIDKFKNYKAGMPNKTLYIKSLPKTVKEKDLASLFARYYQKDSADVQYKIMTGKMRGQAFVTFEDEQTAMEALLLCNGYKLQGKPIIISYGKQR